MAERLQAVTRGTVFQCQNYSLSLAVILMFRAMALDAVYCSKLAQDLALMKRYYGSAGQEQHCADPKCVDDTARVSLEGLPTTW